MKFKGFTHIGNKIITTIGVIVSFSLLITMYIYHEQQEATILAQNESTLLQLTDTASRGLQTIMLAGYADIAQEFADQLKNTHKLSELFILRINGVEAFRDNKTIESVNKELGEEEFIIREQEQENVILPARHKDLRKAIITESTLSYYETDSSGLRYLTIVAPILSQEKCHKCHGSEQSVRGILKLTTSLETVNDEIEKSQNYLFLIFGIAIVTIILLTNYMIQRSIVKPVERVTKAMSSASGGNLFSKVPELGHDEINDMAKSFNYMTDALLKAQTGLENEQNKLATIILSVREGIVATDSDGAIVLVNPSAERLLGKSREQILKEGFLNLLDDPAIMHKWLEEEPLLDDRVEYHHKDKILSVYASTIFSKDNELMGSAALLRDITKVKQMEDELRSLATTDALTGLHNRRYLDEILTQEISRSIRHGLCLSILFFDVDHFKQFNDKYGHDQGDRVLKAVGDTFKQNLRGEDTACRYGGEEFMGILPNITVEQAWTVAERLRKSVETMRVNNLDITISIGIAEFPIDNPITAGEFISMADQAIYTAKDAGRNRSVCAVNPHKTS